MRTEPETITATFHRVFIEKEDAMTRVPFLSAVSVSIVVLLSVGVAAEQPPSQLPNPPVNVNVTNATLPVEITNGTLPVSLAGTVTVKSSDEPGRSPYAAQMNVDNAAENCFLAGGDFQICDYPGGFPTVPAGKRLVITNISGTARAAAGCKISDMSLKTSNFGGTFNSVAYSFLVPHPNLAIPEAVNFNDRILAFVEAGSAPVFGLSASCAGLRVTSQVVNLFGYFVTLP